MSESPSRAAVLLNILAALSPLPIDEQFNVLCMAIAVNGSDEQRDSLPLPGAFQAVQTRQLLALRNLGRLLDAPADIESAADQHDFERALSDGDDVAVAKHVKRLDDSLADYHTDKRDDSNG